MKKTIDNLMEKYGIKDIENPEENREHENYYYNRYKILETILGESVINISNKDAIETYYGVENEKYLTPVDFVIARIISTLQTKSNKDVFKEYESQIKLGKDDPEYLYLAEKVEEFLKDS